MSIPQELKKKISIDWCREFSQLSPFVQNKLYKIVGPIIMGIELLKLPRSDDYRPVFVCYPLWKNNLNECMNEPLILKEFYNRRGFQFNISYMKHELFFQEAVCSIKEQAMIPFDKDIYIYDLFNLINKQYSYLLVKSSPVQQIKLFELKLYSALYLDDSFIINNTFNELINAAKHWPPNLFEWKYGKFDDLLNGISEKIKNKDMFFEQIEINIHDKRMKGLKKSKLLK